MPRTSQSLRQPGVVYTPDRLANWLAQLALHAPGCPRQPTVVDPACGEGALLIAMYDALRQTSASASSGAEEHQQRLTTMQLLHGVEIDPVAADHCRRHLAQHIGSDTPGLEALLERQIRHGDALLGPDWQAADLSSETTARFAPSPSDNRSSLLPPDSKVQPTPAVNWPRCFPSVAAQGGFDLVIANPPYRRERSGGDWVDALAASALGRAWQQPRMDLWYYFAHRGLDLANSRGSLCFLVPAYWLTATSATRLRQRLCAEAPINSVVWFGKRKLFPGVTGQHLMFRATRGSDWRDCTVINASDSPITGDLYAPQTSGRESSSTGTPIEFPCPTWTGPTAKLWQRGRMLLSGVLSTIETTSEEVAGAVADRAAAAFNGQPVRLRELGQAYEVRQGLAENPPWITHRHVERWGDRYQVGAGVFALSPDEIAATNWTDDERQRFRPYYSLSQLSRYACAPNPSHMLLYLTPHTTPSLDNLPNLRRHLEPYRELLSVRREVERGRIAWWHLHWPRTESLFCEPRILFPQMVARPSGVWVTRPTFVGFSVNVVRATATSTWSLPALTAILNSNLAQAWFEQHAKRRGINLDISGTILKEFPLLEFNVTLDQELARLASKRQSLSEADELGDAARYETEIDALVARAYHRQDRTAPDPA